MKKTLIAIAIASMCILCGCRSPHYGCGDGPVAPENTSYEKSETGDPQLPPPNVWWK